jgi:hypothetical protein
MITGAASSSRMVAMYYRPCSAMMMGQLARLDLRLDLFRREISSDPPCAFAAPSFALSAS